MMSLDRMVMTPASERAAAPGSAAVDVTVVVPVTERPDPLVELYREYAEPLRASGRSFEFLFVAHPYFRTLTSRVRELTEAGEPVQLIEAGRSIGETALLRLALESARGRIIITLPAYRQVTASAIPALLAKVEGDADFAVASRWPRRDAWINRFQNRLLHLFVGRFARGRLHDVACGVRAIRREALASIPLYGDFARFLPLLALYHGQRLVEVPSPQHPSDMAGRLYGPGVYLRRMIDIIGLFFLLRFTDKPLRFFGLIGSGMVGAGAVMMLVLLAQRVGGTGIADRPLLVLSVLLCTIGLQSIALGLIGEMIVHYNASRRRIYRVRTVHGRQGA